jgi:CubicO group peptidase (beta-lactamase class C family)
MKTRNLPKILIFYLGGILTFIILVACSKDLFNIPGSIQEEVDKMCEQEFDGMIVYVNQAGESSFYSGGWKDRANKVPCDPHARFKIASISKLYIAAATSKLVASGDISLNSTLVEFIPEVSGRIENAEAISLKMMLQHRSGIPEYVYHPDFVSNTVDYMTTAALIYDQEADFEPDKKYKYSNTNYLLIGEILDRTLGYSHHDYITNEIIIPLGLENTYNLYADADSTEVMSGYFKGHDADLKTQDHTQPGGSMVASAEDVGIFLRALIDGTLFTDQEQEIYTSVYKYEHTGWLNGYTSIVRYHPGLDAVVVQFVNTSSTSMYWLKLERVYGRIIKILEKN